MFSVTMTSKSAGRLSKCIAAASTSKCSTLSSGNSVRNTRVATSEITATLESLVARRQPPQAAGREVKLRFATQVEVAPPTIAVFGNHPELVQEHYVRYLHNGYRAAYGWIGAPLRIVMKRKSGD